MPRDKPLRGRVTSQSSRPQFHKFWIAIGKICCKRKRIWFDKDGAINEHRGNSCEAVWKYRRKEVILVGIGKWNDSPACESSKRDSLQAEISKLVMRLVRRCDQHERETDCAVHWKLMGPKLRKNVLGGWRAKIFRIRIGSSMFAKEATKRGSSIARTQEMSSCTFVLVKDTLSIQMEGIPISSRTLLQCRFNPQIRTHRWRTRKQRRKTDDLPHTSQPIREHSDEEEPGDDLSKPRKEHYHSKWKLRQDAVYWINLARAQDKGLQFWQTRSHAIIVCNSVPTDCIQSKGGKRFIWKTFDTSSCTEDSSQECLAITAAAPAVLLQAPGNWCEKMNKVPQQSTQNHRASGNRCALKELHKMWS